MIETFVFKLYQQEVKELKEKLDNLRESEKELIHRGDQNGRVPQGYDSDGSQPASPSTTHTGFSSVSSNGSWRAESVSEGASSPLHGHFRAYLQDHGRTMVSIYLIILLLTFRWVDP